MSDRTRFASRFPSVARLLATAGIGTAPALEAPEDPAGDDDQDDEAVAAAAAAAAKGGGKTVSQEALATAFEADGKKLVTAERTRWSTVLESEAGKKNVGTARRLLAKTEMSASDIIESLEEDGGESASGKAQERERSMDRGRSRLREAPGVDRDIGGGGGSERTAGKGDELEERRERRREMQDRRNERAEQPRGARRDVAGGGARRRGDR
jgi:hypothetical protein